VQPNLRAVLDLLEDLRSGVVDQRDVVGHQDLGSQVRVAPGDRRRGVDHPRDAGVDERVSGHPVEIQNVQHGDVAVTDAPQQAIDVPVHAGRSDDARPVVRVTGEKR